MNSGQITLRTCFQGAALVVLLLFCALQSALAANVNGRISGVVTDPQQAVVPGVQITATNTATGVQYETVSGADGNYLFHQLPIGSYSIKATMQGFQTFTATGIVLKIDQQYVEDIQLKVGSQTEVIQVTESAVQVDTTDMQFSNVVDSQQMMELPLIGRNFATLQITLPGVQQASGGDRIGGYSVSGSQQQQTSFMINGADTNDIALNTQVLTPILDAVGQFNLIDGPMNAEYSRNSGGVVSATIKSGTNTVHGDAFEFYRDTFLNTNNFFQKHVDGSPSKVSPFHQHIVGGVLGGPILKNKLFVFGAFQYTPQSVPQSAGSATVYTSSNLAGDFSTNNGPAGARPAPDPKTGVVPDWGGFSGADPIPSTVTVPGCTTAGEVWSQCAYDLNGKFPTSAFNSVSTNLVKTYVPPPNSGATGYLFNATTQSGVYQYDGRVDFSPGPKDQMSFVGLYLTSTASNTLPFSGASLPGFGDGNVTHTQQYSFDYIRQVTTSMVNDLSLHWTRLNFKASYPQKIVQPSSVGFSIIPQDKAAATIPTLAVTGYFTLGGTNNGPQPRIDQNYQVDDGFSWIHGRHSLKFGYDGRRFNVSQIFDASNSGSYSFNNTASPYGTGDPGLDFLLGIPASYAQATGSIIEADAFLNYLYAQDTWKATPTLNVNMGLGYSIDTPLRNHQFGGLAVACFIPGQQSKTFPGAPVNMSFPGDRGCTFSGQAYTRHSELGPRLGFSWAPDLGRISGGPGKLSIRGGFGIYYNRTEQESALQTLGTPPFGFTSLGAGDFGGVPSLANPWADINGGQNTGSNGGAGQASQANRFPYIPPKAGAAVDFSPLEPIFNISGFGPSFRAPYAENFQLSVEREFPSNVVTRLSYVGSLGRHNQSIYEANPETPAGHAACLADPVCATTGARNLQALYYPNHKAYPSTEFPEMGMVGSEASSSYNAFQASVTKGQTHGLLFQLSYTWAHALDTGSSFENSGFGYAGERGFNQYEPRLNYGNSLYDARQRLVFSPVYAIPFKHDGGPFNPLNMILGGWEVSGIVTVATGFPYDVSYAGGTSRSLWCDASLSFYACPDIPEQVAPLKQLNPRIRDPKHSGYSHYFSSTNFAAEPLGGFGNMSRNPFHGPGINNTNAIIAKNFNLGGEGTRSLQLRMESDNVFNHTQFANPTSTMGSSNMGYISSAAAARQTQLGARITF